MIDLIVTDPSFPMIVNTGLLLAIVVLFMRRNLALGVFLFSTLFFAYSIFPLLVSSSIEVKHHWFANPSPSGLSIVAATFFVVVALAATNKEMPLWSLFGRLPWLSKLALGMFGVSIPIVYLVTVVTSGTFGVTLTIKGMISALGMLVIALLLAALSSKSRKSQGDLRTPIRMLLGVQCVCVGVAAWEIASLDAWIANRFTDGLLELRASSIFLNPNFFAAWTVSMLIAGGFLANRSRGLANVSLVLSALALFLSGSRSLLLLSFAVMVVPAILCRWCRIPTHIPMASLVVFSVFFFAIICASIFAPIIAPPDWHKVPLVFYALADRFISLPGDILAYLSGAGKEHIKISIDGRFFVGETVDNAFLAMAAAGNGIGYVSAGFLAGFVLATLWAGLKRLAVSPCWNGIYAVSAMAYCIALGMVMQAYQAFPIWAFCAVFMGLYFQWLLGDETRSG